MKKSMLSELARLAGEAGLSPEDYVCELVTEGETLRSIAADLSRSANRDISPGTLGAWLNADPARRAKLVAARKDSAPALVEKAIEILDNVDNDRDAIAAAKAQSEVRTWLASKYDRQTFGNDTAQVNVQLNLGQLHLDALRQRATAAPILPPAGPDYETVIEPGSEPSTDTP